MIFKMTAGRLLEMTNRRNEAEASVSSSAFVGPVSFHVHVSDGVFLRGL